MRTSPARLALVTIVFVAALVGGLLLVRGSDEPGSRGAGGDDRRGSGEATSDIWKVGDTWEVVVSQDAGAVSPDGVRNVAKVPFRFKVTDAPEGSSDAWVVRVDQEGAEGPFAAGWRLHYVEDDGAMVLSRVAIGEDKPLEAQLATIVLGNQFPYETRYEAPPKDATITAAKLIERSTLPPSAGPGAGTDREVGAGDAPVAPPIDQAVVPGGDAPMPPER